MAAFPRMQTVTHDDRRLLAGSLLALSLSSAAFAATAAWLAARHMAGIAALCGPEAAHCGWCVTGAAAATAALLVLAAAARLLRGPRLLPVRAD